jgi:hypothetical protein
MKKVIRLTESDLHKMIKESVTRILNENNSNQSLNLRNVTQLLKFSIYNQNFEIVDKQIENVSKDNCYVTLDFNFYDKMNNDIYVNVVAVFSINCGYDNSEEIQSNIVDIEKIQLCDITNKTCQNLNCNLDEIVKLFNHPIMQRYCTKECNNVIKK